MRNKQEQLISEWVGNLRSKKYRQGYKMLLTSNGEHCCLGVLCDIIDPDFKTNWKNMVIPPVACMEPVNLETSNGDHKVSGIHKIIAEEYNLDCPCLRTTLASLNDQYKWPFEAIADLIEARPEGLFLPS